MMMMRVEVSALCVCVHQEVVHWGGGDAALPAHAGACQQLDAARGLVVHERRLHRQQDGSRGPSPVAPGTPVAVPQMHQQVQVCAQIVVLQTVRVRHCVRGFVQQKVATWARYAAMQRDANSAEHREIEIYRGAQRHSERWSDVGTQCHLLPVCQAVGQSQRVSTAGRGVAAEHPRCAGL